MNNRYENLILVSDKTQLTMAYKIYDRFSSMHKKSLIITGFDVKIEDAKYVFRNMQFYQQIFMLSFNGIQQDAYNLFCSLAQSEVYKGMTLRKLTSFKEVSLWDLSARDLNSEILPYLYYLNIGDKILDFENPKKVYIIDSGNTLNKIFYLLCKKKTIDCYSERMGNNNFISSIIKKCIYKKLIGVKKVKRLFVSIYYLFLNLTKSFGLNKTYKVIFFVPLERFFISMLPVIHKYEDLERLVINVFPNGSSKKLRENKIFYMDFYGYKLYSLFNWKVRNFLKKISTTVHNNDFFSKASYKGIALGDLFANIIERLISNNFPEKIRMIEIIRKVLFLYRPNAVVVSDTSYDISLIAKKLSHSVIAVQCAHPKEFIHFGPVVADAITVDGNFWRDYLIKHNVAADKIWVAGPPKYDILKNTDNYTKKINLLNNILTIKKIIVFATPYSSLAMGTIGYEKIEKLRSVCSALKNIKNTYLIIKLHPFDNDWCVYERVAKETGLLNYMVIKNIEMLRLLRYCDLLITYYSVVGYEAVLMDKNVIWIRDPTDFQSDDIWDFRRSGAVMIVDNLAELENCIRDALFDSQALSILKKNREGYRFEHAYKLDRNAADRVKEIIDRFV